MNVSTLVAFLIALAVFVISLMTTTDSFGVFFSGHAALIVIGGTLAASFICFSFGKVFGLTKVFVRRMLGKSKRDYGLLIKEVSNLSSANRKGRQALESTINGISDPFLRDAARILFWLDAEVPHDKLRRLLETRAETHFERYLDEASIFNVMAKFPPAFGLMGTTLGMIALLKSLGSADSKNQIGPSMAIALVATLYGIVISNFIFIPIAENLKIQTKEDLVARRMVVEGVMLIAAGMPTKFVEEQLQSFLLPSERPPEGSYGTAGTAAITPARKAG